MIAWLNPGALAGLGLLVGPILVHLLLRHRASRVPFPSLRFVRSSRTAAVRVRLPADLALLVLRLAIVAMAVSALAQPLVVTRTRLAGWNARTARVVLIDTSDSMRRFMSVATEASRAELRMAAFAFDVSDPDLGTGLVRAVEALSTAPPARREIVVVSDFQWGALRTADLQMVPSQVGLRFIQVGAPEPIRSGIAMDEFRPGGAARQEFVLSPDGTAFPSGLTPLPGGGLVLLARPADTVAVETLQRVVASVGAPAASTSEPMVIAMAGASLPKTVRALDPGWMLDTALRLKGDPEVAAACASMDDSPSDPGPRVADPGGGHANPATLSEAEAPWRVLYRDSRGLPLVRAAVTDASLLIYVAAPPSAFVTAAVVRGALVARQGSVAHPEDEIRRMSAADLNGYTRAPAAVDTNAPYQGLASDARFCWAVVLVLLLLEALVRRERRVESAEVHTDAA